MKKIYSFVLAVLLLLSGLVLPVNAAPTSDDLGGFASNGMTYNTATTDEGFVYKLKQDGTAAVCGAPENLTELTIPASVDGYKVSEVTTYNQRFQGSDTVKKLTISDGIERLSFFLRCFKNAEEIYLPSTLVEIKSMSFIDSTAYYKNEANWDNGCLYIGTNLLAVNADAPEILSLREDTTCIADELYRPINKNVKEIILPTFEVNGLLNFIPRNSLQRVTIPAALKEIPVGLFSSCHVLEDVIIEEGIEKISDRCFFECFNLTNVEIPASVNTIGERAFGMCDGFTEFAIPDTVKVIEKQAFAGCKNLMLVEIPDSVTYIGEQAIGFGNSYYSSSSDHGLGYSKTKHFTVCAPLGSEGERYAVKNEFYYEKSKADYEASMDEIDYNNPRDFDKFTFGDADLDGKVTVKDATYIQKATAGLLKLEYKVQHFIATVNLDFDINVRDATLIQKHLAGMEIEFPIGQIFTWEELFQML